MNQGEDGLPTRWKRKKSFMENERWMLHGKAGVDDANDNIDAIDDTWRWLSLHGDHTDHRIKTSENWPTATKIDQAITQLIC